MRDASKYTMAGVPSEKMGFWNNLEGYFHNLKRTEIGAEPWALLSLKERKLSRLLPQPQSEPVLIPENIGNALNKERAPIPEVFYIMSMMGM